MFKVIRRLLPVFACSLFAAATMPAAHANNYPIKPVTLVVGFPPGGGVDILARQLADSLSRQLGQPIIVDNRPGAAGNIAMDYVARAKSDGYTLLVGNLGMFAANPYIYPKLGFDASTSFTPVARLVVTPLLAAVPSSLPVQTVPQFVEMAKKTPGQVFFGSGGNGNIAHLAGELLNESSGTQLVHVPYKGSAPALTALISDDVQLVIDGINVVQPQIAGGRVRAIAITGESRSPSMPQVPTMKEAGFPNMTIYGWQGLFAPAGTPQAVTDRLGQEVQKALAEPILRAKLISQGTDPSYQLPIQFKEFIAAEQQRWSKLIHTANITLK